MILEALTSILSLEKVNSVALGYGKPKLMYPKAEI